ncbi:MAG: ExbD/TolR family protein [Opitutales bacterium]|jgi:biopolymer transport protein ExbD
MSSRTRLHKGEEGTDINISPMIDMVFILLIFFIVTTVFVEEEGIGVDKPTPQPPETEQEKKDEPVMLKVTVANQIIHEGKPITLNRVETVVKNALSKADVPVIMQVERGALSGTMIQVMDRAKLGGADKISVTAVDASS